VREKIATLHTRRKPNPEWRPFEKRSDKAPVNDPDKDMPFITGLSQDSAKKCQKVIESMFNYLVDFGYLLGNPAITRKQRSSVSHTRKKVKERFLDSDLIDFTIDQLYVKQQEANDLDKPTFPFLRARYIIQLLAGTGLRISESAHHTMGDITCKKDKWMWWCG
jgi:site-specific recombinase XerD